MNTNQKQPYLNRRRPDAPSAILPDLHDNPASRVQVHLCVNLRHAQFRMAQHCLSCLQAKPLPNCCPGRMPQLERKPDWYLGLQAGVADSATIAGRVVVAAQLPLAPVSLCLYRGLAFSLADCSQTSRFCAGGAEHVFLGPKTSQTGLEQFLSARTKEDNTLPFIMLSLVSAWPVHPDRAARTPRGMRVGPHEFPREP
jgi:hypothetical protein